MKLTNLYYSHVIWFNYLKDYPKTAKNEKKLYTNSIFPTGLKFNVKSHDVEEMREQAAFWSFEHNQLERGKFEGKTLAYHTRNLQLSLTSRSVGVSIYGEIPPETTIISFPLYPVNTIYFRGQLVRKHQLLSLNHSDELDLHTLFPSTLLTVAVSTKVLESQAFSLLGRSFVKSCSQELPLMKTDAYCGSSNFLISQLKDLNRRNCLLAKIDEDVVEKELIETIFLGMDWGFLHLGRFSEQYSRLFGELPRKTRKVQ